MKKLIALMVLFALEANAAIVVESTASSVDDTASTSQTHDYPAGVVSGNELIAFCTADATQTL